MWMLIAALALGDLVILALWRRERRRHAKSRVALRFWRERAGLKDIPVDRVEDDMVTTMRALQQRSGHIDRIHLAKTGGAA